MTLLAELRRVWRECAIEAAGAAALLAAAFTYATLLQHPASPVRQAIDADWLRRSLMGAAMGTTVLALIYSPWGRRSGAHFNAAVTLAFLRLGRIPAPHAGAYVLAHFAGALAGGMAAAAALGTFAAHPTVHYVLTTPGPAGAGVAFAAELAISALLLSVVLAVMATPGRERLAGVAAAALVGVFIALESPLSGASMNPSRSFGSAAAAGEWATLWVYVAAPPLGMLLAAERQRRRLNPTPRSVAHACAKLCHDDRVPCAFCDYRARHAARLTSAPSVAASEPAGTIRADVSL